jgi:ubiquitin-conjugating enzyme E2 G1
MSYNFIPAELSRNPPDGVSVGLGDDENIFKWELMIVGPPDTLYEGGFFAALLEFPPDFPNAPPTMTFKTPIWHPNGSQILQLAIQYSYYFGSYVSAVYEDGKVCISILHPPGEDAFAYVGYRISCQLRVV